MAKAKASLEACFYLNNSGVENQDLQNIIADAEASIENVSDKPQWEQLKATLGPNGSLTQFAKGIASVPKEDRPAFGKSLSKQRTSRIPLSKGLIAIEELEDLKSLGSRIDPTLPSSPSFTGGIHPLTKTAGKSSQSSVKLDLQLLRHLKWKPNGLLRCT